MMGTTVLGKRSRNSWTEEIASSQPLRKRTTRRSNPQIYEDAAAIAAQIPAHAVAKSVSVRSSKSSALSPKSRPTSTFERVNIELPDVPSSIPEYNENCPPVGASASTPSTIRFKNVLDGTPSTPKRRVRLLGGLFTPQTPRTYDATASRSENVYTRARQLFAQSTSPSKLIGRDIERQQVRNCLNNAKSTRCGGCTYISGPPGTGKSALVHEVLEDFKEDPAFCVSVINCVSLRTAAQVYGKLVEDFCSTSSTKSTPEVRLRRLFTSKSGKTNHVVMLDEIDSLVDAECEVLYNLFDWALHPSSSLTLIGIANALDLTDRFLPRLKSKGLKPQLLPFTPYTSQQISTIITDKLRTLLPKDTTVATDFVPCIHPAAVQLCGKKIASQTGDLRKAFNLIRKAIDQVEKECLAKQAQDSPSKRALTEVVNVSKEAGISAKTPRQCQLSFTAENAPRASIAHMAKLASSIFNNGTSSRLAGLNLQQKAVLCSIISKESRRQQRDPYITPTKSTNKAPTVGELFTKYTLLCRRDDGILQPLKDTEFRDVVASLETLGLVHESKARSSGLLTPSSSSRNREMHNDRAIASVVAEKEMRESLVGAGADLLKRLLDEA
ncbi:AAA ATPase [Lithohypha guttulata]|nr:AAA ATPase [Lithohypha guttulata]KAK5104672.1 AAA ATPase [Lithohypha guttulata]